MYIRHTRRGTFLKFGVSEKLMRHRDIENGRKTELVWIQLKDSTRYFSGRKKAIEKVWLSVGTWNSCDLFLVT